MAPTFQTNFSLVGEFWEQENDATAHNGARPASQPPPLLFTSYMTDVREDAEKEERKRGGARKGDLRK